MYYSTYLEVSQIFSKIYSLIGTGMYGYRRGKKSKSTIVLIIGTLKKVPLVLGNPYVPPLKVPLLLGNPHLNG